MPMTANHLKANKMDARWEPGTWLGFEPRTDEVRIGTASGIVKARSVRRRPESERWNAEAIRKIVGTPWEPVPGKSNEAGKLGEIIVDVPGKDADAPHVHVPEPIEPGLNARRMNISKEEIERLRYLDGCSGCRPLRVGARQTSHSDGCRSRIVESLS